MKNKTFLWVFLTIILIIVGYNVYDRYFKKVPNGMVLVSQATLDSLKAYIEIADSLESVANSVPDTIYKDTLMRAEVFFYDNFYINSYSCS